MKRVIFAVLCSFFALTTAWANVSLQSAQSSLLNGQQPTLTAANAPAIIPPPPNVNAKGYVVMDANSGKIIAQKNMNEQMQPASLTKLMTLYIAEEALAQGQISLTDKVRVSKVAWSTGGSRMFLKLGSHVQVQKLIQGIIVASGNDACVALAQFIAGTQNAFAKLMNMTAKRLGMTKSHFVDPTGLPRPGHVTTPHDLAVLTRHIILDYPQYYHFFSEKWIDYNHIRQPNRNRLLWRMPGVDGLKTGHTKEAGYCLIASGVQHGMRLISVVMGTPTDAARANDSQALLNWGFRFYNSHKIFSANTPITKKRIWMGNSKYVAMGLARDLFVTIPTGQYKKLKASMDIPKKLEAPIVKGQTYGNVSITLNGKVIATAPIIALTNDARGGLWTRMTDHIALWFK